MISFWECSKIIILYLPAWHENVKISVWIYVKKWWHVNISLYVWKNDLPGVRNQYKNYVKMKSCKILCMAWVLYIIAKTEPQGTITWTYDFHCFWKSSKNLCQNRCRRMKKIGYSQFWKWILTRTCDKNYDFR